MRRAAALALSVLAACARVPASSPAAPAPAPPVARYRLEDAPRELGPAVARADAAIRTLRDRLLARLAAEIAAAGPASAIRVCRGAAPGLAQAVSAQTGVTVGRTSARLRSGGNAPPAWAAAAVEETAARKASEVSPAVFDLGDRVGVMRPIAVAQLCVACHGGADRLAPEVKAALEATYPADRAIGFAEGDLHGFFWAEAKK